MQHENTLPAEVTDHKQHLQVAGCIILNEDGELLVLHRRSARRTHWEIPGGKIEPDEDPAHTAKRELAEELGVSVDIVRKIGERLFDEDDAQIHYQWFLAHINTGEPQIQEPHLYDKFGFLAPVTLTRRYDELSLGLKNFLEAVAYGEIDLDI